VTLKVGQGQPYRPVSNLSFASKIAEKVVASRLKKHLSDNHLNEPRQSAYRSRHSTKTALLAVSNDILRAVDNKQAVLLVLLDLSAAFDTIDHHILSERLQERFGVTSTAGKWIMSYLTNHVQMIQINGDQSEQSTLLYGVPQGSVLGPLLFTAYIVL
jgi:hypothetical protein